MVAGAAWQAGEWRFAFVDGAGTGVGRVAGIERMTAGGDCQGETGPDSCARSCHQSTLSLHVFDGFHGWHRGLPRFAETVSGMDWKCYRRFVRTPSTQPGRREMATLRVSE